MFAPLGILLGLITIYRFSWVYLLFFMTLPFSIEIYLPSGLGTDLPTEPLMLVLTAISIVLFLYRLRSIPKAYLYNPISYILIFHVFWIFFTTIYSQNQVVSIKYFLAKCWYVIPFFFLGMYILQDKKWTIRWRSFFTVALTISVTYVMIRHAAVGFSFDGINKAGSPIYRNHVNYAALLVVFLPYLWSLWADIKEKYSLKSWIVLGVMAYMILAIYFTYTRAAHVCVVFILAGYWVVRQGWLRQMAYSAILVLTLGISMMFVNNRYLDFAPDYERTVTHHSYDNLLEATYKMEDLSTMERVYRWVAGIQMIQEKPLLGFGPGTFYFFYKSYSVNSFKTYVSHNPDKSGIHNYYLMTFVEQGVLGFLIFLLLNIIALFYGERVYHRLTDPYEKRLVMASILSLIVINAMLLINDLIEADKVGPFFFFNLAVIVVYGVKSHNEEY